MRIHQSVVVNAPAGGGGGFVGVIAVAAAVVLLVSGVLAAVVQALVMVALVLAGSAAATVVARWAWLRHQRAARPLGRDGNVVICADPQMVDGRSCQPCRQQAAHGTAHGTAQVTAGLERPAVAVALHPGGTVTAVCAAHLAVLHLAAAAHAATTGATAAQDTAGQDTRRGTARTVARPGRRWPP